jgi:Transcriptional regulators
MNIYDISEKAGVSIATVSRVLNENSNVSEQTRKKVLAVIEECGYTPNVFARGLGLGTMKTIGIMCSDSSDPYLAGAIYFLERELRQSGYDSILCCTGYDLENKRQYLNLLLSKKIDALILLGSKFVEPKAKDNTYIFEAAKKVPIMLVNGYLEGDNIYSTVCDDFSAVNNTVKRLIENDRKRILYLYSSISYSGTNKLNGYKSALTDCGINIDESLIIRCSKDIDISKKLLLSLYDKGMFFDSVVTSDDTIAVGAVKFALEKGIKIPDELSIVGYNNSILAICSEPEITSLDTKVEALCVSTVNTLMSVFSGGNVTHKTTISSDLIIRKTTNF